MTIVSRLREALVGRRGVAGLCLLVLCVVTASALVAHSQSNSDSHGRDKHMSSLPPVFRSLQGKTPARQERHYKGKDLHGRQQHFGSMSHTMPARLLPADSSNLPSEDISYVTSGWEAGDHLHYTAVYAGASDADRDKGEFAIFRYDYDLDKQTIESVFVAGAGPLRITDAPVGTGRVETRAQQSGQFGFTSAHGVNGTLNLKEDSVSINQ